MLNEKNIETFKKLLLNEKGLLTHDLEAIAIYNEKTRDWVPRHEPRAADEEVTKLDNQTDETILVSLEARYRNMMAALGRIEKGEFGKCGVCSKEIEMDRLNANPAANTCIEHKEQNN